VVGKTALDNGNDEIKQLADSSKKAFSVADSLAKFLRDIDDPRRAVEIDARAGESTGRTNSQPGKRDTMGYTGMEGLLNYVFYQAGAISQYDQITHLLHFSIFEVGAGPCADYNAGPTVPSKDGGETTDISQAHRCVAWLGDNQPGINSGPQLDPYDGSVCPDGSTDTSICDPNNTSSRKQSALTSAAEDATDVRGSDGSTPYLGDLGGDTSADSSGTGDDDGSSAAGDAAGEVRDALPGGLDEVLDLPNLSEDLGLRPRANDNSPAGGGDSTGAPTGGDQAAATNDLLGYLFDD